MEVYVASLIFYAYVYLICYALRRRIRESRSLTDELKQFLCETIGTIQVCAPIFDVGFILDIYGLVGVFVEILLLELLNAYTLEEAYAHPYALLDSWRLRRRKDVRSLGSLFSAQCLGAFLSYYVSLLFWALKLVPEHYDRYHEGRLCAADLTVSVLAGFVVEALATIICRVAELESEKYVHGYEPYACSTVSAFLTVLGIRITGLYANPIVASACTFNCVGVSTSGHFIVYWLGPLFGWIVGDLVVRQFLAARGHHHHGVATDIDHED